MSKEVGAGRRFDIFLVSARSQTCVSGVENCPGRMTCSESESVFNTLCYHSQMDNMSTRQG